MLLDKHIWVNVSHICFVGHKAMLRPSHVIWCSQPISIHKNKAVQNKHTHTQTQTHLLTFFIRKFKPQCKYVCKIRIMWPGIWGKVDTTSLFKFLGGFVQCEWMGEEWILVVCCRYLFVSGCQKCMSTCCTFLTAFVIGKHVP